MAPDDTRKQLVSAHSDGFEGMGVLCIDTGGLPVIGNITDARN